MKFLFVGTPIGRTQNYALAYVRTTVAEGGPSPPSRTKRHSGHDPLLSSFPILSIRKRLAIHHRRASCSLNLERSNITVITCTFWSSKIVHWRSRSRSAILLYVPHGMCWPWFTLSARFTVRSTDGRPCEHCISQKHKFWAA